MTQRYEVRILSSLDVSLMRSLLGMFAIAFRDSETYLGNQPSDAYLSGLLAKPHFIAIAATIHEIVVGGVTAYQLDKFEQDRREDHAVIYRPSQSHMSSEVKRDRRRRSYPSLDFRYAYWRRDDRK